MYAKLNTLFLISFLIQEFPIQYKSKTQKRKQNSNKYN